VRRRLLVMTAALLTTAGAASAGAGGWLYAKAWLAQVLLRRAWAEVEAGEKGARPWPWADTSPVARLRVPGHGVDAIVLAGASGRTMAFGPAHADGSAAPGALGNCVLAGHRDTHFAFLRNLRAGDGIELERPDGEIVRYRVADSRVVDQSETWVGGESDGPLLTLVTCYPFTDPVPGGPLRFVVWAEADVGEGR